MFLDKGLLKTRKKLEMISAGVYSNFRKRQTNSKKGTKQTKQNIIFLPVSFLSIFLNGNIKKLIQIDVRVKCVPKTSQFHQKLKE